VPVVTVLYKAYCVLNHQPEQIAIDFTSTLSAKLATLGPDMRKLMQFLWSSPRRIQGSATAPAGFSKEFCSIINEVKATPGCPYLNISRKSFTAILTLVLQS
jgi:hypothetical protein